jgi:hypothetical protein
MLSADPYVQVPEYSQNFNRYSYVLNNPLNKTDPTGYSWLSKAFHKIGSWVKENWRSIVSIALGALLMFTGVGAMLAGNLLFGAMGLQSVSVLAFNATMGAITGGIMGAASAALAGGDFGDILKGAAVGAVQGAISSGPLHAMEGVRGLEVAHVVGHGVTGGAANVAMGGKFQDGFLSAAAGAAATHTGIYGKFKGAGAINAAGRTAVAGIIGGTASALGAGKFANGAWTAAFQHLLNAELTAKPRRLIIEGEHEFGKNPADHIRKDPNYESVTVRVSTAEEFNNALTNNGKYDSLVYIGHSGAGALFISQAAGENIVTDGSTFGGINVKNLNALNFTGGSSTKTIFLIGCNTAVKAPEYGGLSTAQEFSRHFKAIAIGSGGPASFAGGTGGLPRIWLKASPGLPGVRYGYHFYSPFKNADYTGGWHEFRNGRHQGKL